MSSTAIYSQYVKRQDFDVNEEVNKFIGDEPVELVESDTQCLICRKVLSTEFTLKLHYSVHTGVYPLLCKLCSFGSVNMTNMTYHLKTVHQIGEKSDLIERKSRTHVSVKNGHEKELPPRKSTDEEDPDWGLYVTEQQVDPDAELKKVLEGQDLAEVECDTQCIICRKVMSNMHSLRLHYSTHTGVYRFLCKVCSFGAVNMTNMVYHLKTVHHFGSKPNAREKKSTTSPQIEKIPERRPKATSSCTKDEVDWELHVKVNSKKLASLRNAVSALRNEDIQMFRNQICIRCGDHRPSLRHHYLVHIDICPYKCRLCLRKFQWKQGAVAHVKRKHREELTGCSLITNGYEERREEREEGKDERMIDFEEDWGEDIQYVSTSNSTDSSEIIKTEDGHYDTEWHEEDECTCDQDEEQHRPTTSFSTSCECVKQEIPNESAPVHLTITNGSSAVNNFAMRTMVPIEEYKPFTL